MTKQAARRDAEAAAGWGFAPAEDRAGAGEL